MTCGIRQIFILAIAIIASDCGRPSSNRRIAPEYDSATGKLRLLKYDSNGNGKTDTWSYMDGSRVVRIEIDKDEDGKIDRWEYTTLTRSSRRLAFRDRTMAKKTRGRTPRPDGI